MKLAAVMLPVAMAGHLLDLPARYMWGWDRPGTPKNASGYCGSVSVQTAGIYYGNWLTEDAIRGTSGGHDAAHSLLIVYPKDHPSGYPISLACKNLKLKCSMWNYDKEKAPQHETFLSWAKRHIDDGAPVIIGVYWGVESDSEYDHIVPMVGYDTEAGDSSTVSAVYFNDLYGKSTIREETRSFVTTRKACKSNHKYGQGAFCLPRKYDYGIAVSGNEDADGVLLPVRLTMDQRSEPDYSKEDQQHETPSMMSATVTVSGLTAGKRYALLRFDSFAAVPSRNFLKAAFAQKEKFVAKAAAWTVRAEFMSNSTTLFRCVEVPAGDYVVV